MELRKRKLRAPLHNIFAVTLFLLQLWAATANINYSESSTQSSATSPSATGTPVLSSSRLFTGGPLTFRSRWMRRRRHRNKVNRASREFLLAHNLVRASVMEPPLEWDGRLAAYARSWANQRVGDCRLVHSNGPYGENIFWAAQNTWSPAEVVKVWADEDQFYNVNANSCEPHHMCGHYTQIVWKDSTKVGCATVDCSNGGVYAICVYNPPGNYEGENPFGSYKTPIGLLREDPPAVIGGMA
ncbi:PREDICTED: pathogenesis-related protein PR-1-like [Camelina sativa]|uniref:Pathogenesis-related protein PR-1-like n=1 Tax=Camelina sativa TaxID=90675 RepID=A0ABM0WQH8_CAMSA|nr:PREDICTED: pathogenesis-related protein PR-1-like [Camelina sativa]